MAGFGALILRYRWAWLVGVALASVFFALQWADLSMEEDETTWYPAGDPVLAAYTAFENRFESNEFVIVAYDWRDPFSRAAIRELRRLTERLEVSIPYVTEALSLTTVDDIVGSERALEVRPLIGDVDEVDVDRLRRRISMNPFVEGNLISRDERTVAIVLQLDRPGVAVYEETSAAILEALDEVIEEKEADTGLRYYMGGSTLSEREVERVLNRDILVFFPLALVLTGGLLFLFFRDLASVLLPLITVVLSLGWTLGLKAVVGSPITPVSTTLFALITVIGVASSVHLISQYRTERSRGVGREDALQATYRRAGRPCLFTALTTAVGFGSLAVSQIPAIRQLGFFAAFGIMTSFLLSMVMVPMGIDRISHRRAQSPRNLGLERALASVGRFDLRHPGLVVGATLALIVGMSGGIFLIESKGSIVDYFRENSRIRTSIGYLDARLNGISSTEVILSGAKDAFLEPEHLEAMDLLADAADGHPTVSAVYSFVDTVKLLNRAFHEDDPEDYAIPESARHVAALVSLYQMSGGSSLGDYVASDYATARISIRTRQMSNDERRALLTDVRDVAERAFPKTRVEITGMDLLVSGVNDRIVVTQIRSFGLAVLVITGMMILVFGWRAGLISAVPNVLPIVFVLGLMGYAGFGLNIATAIIASIAIGIVVDDTIHYFSHFRDELALSGDPAKATLNALTKVGKALCFTTSILVAGFAVFLFARLGILSSYGILSGTAVIAALAGDLFIGPVLLTRIRVFPRLVVEQERDKDGKRT